MPSTPMLPAPVSGERPYSVTFVCTGNICRSPMADVITRALLEERGMGERVHVTSSGTGGWHVGHGADSRTIATLEEHGYDGSPHRARQFDESLFAGYDLIVALDAGHRRALRALAPDEASRSRIALLREFDPEAGDELDVPDPYYGSHADFEDVFAMIERSARALVERLADDSAAHTPGESS